MEESGPASQYSFVAVFDGHGGAATSDKASKLLLSKIVDTPYWKADKESTESIRNALVQGFLDMDEVLKKVRGVMCVCGIRGSRSFRRRTHTCGRGLAEALAPSSLIT